MKYTPSVNIVQQRKDGVEQIKVQSEALQRSIDDIYRLPRNPMGDVTAFIQAATTVDTSKMDDRFTDRNSLKLLTIDKFAAMAALTPIDESILMMIRQDFNYALQFEYWDRAESKALEIVETLSGSRGRHGPYNFSEQMVTTREVLISQHRQQIEEAKKKGTWGGIMRKKPETLDKTEINIQGAQQ